MHFKTKFYLDYFSFWSFRFIALWASVLCSFDPSLQTFGIKEHQKKKAQREERSPWEHSAVEEERNGLSCSAESRWELWGWSPASFCCPLSSQAAYGWKTPQGPWGGRAVLVGVVAPGRVLCCEWKLQSEGSFLKSSVTAKRGAKGGGALLLLAASFFKC